MMRSMFLVISSNTMKNLIIILSALLNTFQLSFFTNQDFLNRGRSTKKILFRSQKKNELFFSIALLLFLSLFLSLVLFQSIKMLFLSSNLFIALFFEYLFYILTIIFLRFKYYSSIKQILLRTYFIALLSFYCNLSYHVAGSQKIFG